MNNTVKCPNSLCGYCGCSCPLCNDTECVPVAIAVEYQLLDLNYRAHKDTSWLYVVKDMLARHGVCYDD